MAALGVMAELEAMAEVLVMADGEGVDDFVISSVPHAVRVRANTAAAAAGPRPLTPAHGRSK